jgi:UDP-N-acetyl-D-glucosamine dehydrogenase
VVGWATVCPWSEAERCPATRVHRVRRAALLVLNVADTPVPSADAIAEAFALLPARETVCVQGLGFVGAATAAAVADASGASREPWFNVIGVDVPTPEGQTKIAAINEGRVPIATSDGELKDALARARDRGNIVATSDPEVFALADIVVVSIPLDVIRTNAVATVDLEPVRRAARELGQRVRPGALVVVQTTVPPGTTEKIVAPELASALRERGHPEDSVLVAHSYERVMPGENYYDSIVNFWRVYAGLTSEAADACATFLSKVVNVERYPLTRLHSTTASETAKLLENSYRATTIALMEEWGRFAEAVGVDLFEVIEGIRLRPTHSNMRQPGFGVGGYCLTKDPLMAGIGASEVFGLGLEFPFSSLAVEVNTRMPLVSIDRLSALLDGSLAGRKILLLGVTYRPGVGDTRQSPSELFFRSAREQGAVIACHDPLVAYWPELDVSIDTDLPRADEFDAVVFAVPHAAYVDLDVCEWLGPARPAILDASNVLPREQRTRLRALGCRVESVGRGDGL